MCIDCEAEPEEMRAHQAPIHLAPSLRVLRQHRAAIYVCRMSAVRAEAQLTAQASERLSRTRAAVAAAALAAAAAAEAEAGARQRQWRRGGRAQPYALVLLRLAARALPKGDGEESKEEGREEEASVEIDQTLLMTALRL